MTEAGLPDSVWTDVDPSAEALLDRWRVAEGDRVEAGQPLADAVLVKTGFEIVAPCKGVVERILVPAGETFGRGVPVAQLREGA